MQGHHDRGTDHHRVDGFVRHRAMAAVADDLDVHRVGRRHERSAVKTQMPDGVTRHVMHGEDRITRKPFEQSVLQHFPGTTQPLFRRLENQVHGAIECPCPGQVLTRRQQDGGMSVVTAGMHDTVYPAGIRQTGGFLDRQRIHVGAQANGPTLAIFQGGNDPGLAHPGADLKAPLSQTRGNPLTGGEFFKTQLRVRVNAVTYRDHFILHRGNTRQNQTGIHECSPSRAVRQRKRCWARS
ncbi:hypothetical protein D3C71_1217160 [compost metagenome]